MVFQIGAAIAILLLFISSFVAMAKTLYHLWFVITGIRHEKRFLASLMGPLVLLNQGLFEEKALPHLKKLNFWLPVTLVIFAALFGLKSLVTQQ